MSRYWVLEGHEPKRVRTRDQWARWIEGAARQVALDHVGDVLISTMFRGVNMAIVDDGPPLLFETMIFGGAHDRYQRRCSTWTEAELLHAEAVKVAQTGDKVTLFPRGMRFER